MQLCWEEPVIIDLSPWHQLQKAWEENSPAFYNSRKRTKEIKLRGHINRMDQGCNERIEKSRYSVQ